MSEWQPIETAPKDGTEVLLWTPKRDVGREVVVGYFVECIDGSRFWAAGRIGEWYLQIPHIATHWMPLPEPPQ